MKDLSAASTSLTDLVEAIGGESSIGAVEQHYLREIRHFIDCPAVGIYVLDHSDSGKAEQYVASGVSDYFLSRYEEVGRTRDPVLHRVLESKNAAHNGELMSVEEWRSLSVYDEVFRLHQMVHLLEAPVVYGNRIIGTLNFGGSEENRPFTSKEVGLANAIGRLVGLTLGALREQDHLRRENEHLVASLELCDEAVVLTDLRSGSRRLNTAARMVLDQLPEGPDGGYVDELLAHQNREEASSITQIELRLIDGREATLRMHSIRLPTDPTMIVSFLMLQGGQRQLPRSVEQSLTRRECEVAQLVARGLQDNEIAERLLLSPFTVKQYLKSTYQKLKLRSRVDLACLLASSEVKTPPQRDFQISLERGIGTTDTRL